jgi:sigma-B regulation protein RsbU (phosphoserine phosphatase)
MFSSASYDEGRIDLAPGDVLVAYSDGLVEARDASDEEFGMERLERASAGMRDGAPEAGGAGLLAEFQTFLGGERPGDDVSLLVVRRKS